VESEDVLVEGVTVEDESAWIKAFVQNEVERREKIVVYVRRGGEYEGGVDVGVEVGSAWVKAFVKNEVVR